MDPEQHRAGFSISNLLGFDKKTEGNDKTQLNFSKKNCEYFLLMRGFHCLIYRWKINLNCSMFDHD